MPKTSKSSASETVEMEGYEGHLENFEGGYTVAFESTPQTPTSRSSSRACRMTNARQSIGGTC